MIFKKMTVKDLAATLALLSIPVLTAAIVTVSLTQKQQVLIKEQKQEDLKPEQTPTPEKDFPSVEDVKLNLLFSNKTKWNAQKTKLENELKVLEEKESLTDEEKTKLKELTLKLLSMELLEKPEFATTLKETNSDQNKVSSSLDQINNNLKQDIEFKQVQKEFSQLDEKMKQNLISDFEQKVEIAKLQQLFTSDPAKFKAEQSKIESQIQSLQKASSMTPEDKIMLNKLEVELLRYEGVQNESDIKKLETSIEEDKTNHTRDDIKYHIQEQKRIQDAIKQKVNDLKLQAELEKQRKAELEKLKKSNPDLEKLRQQFLQGGSLPSLADILKTPSK
ncbi:hypothetical protein [Mycoplasma sp. 1654_15]|uniref:hypothetical protein n=1 Tax=Mycoplasma sp. 1654_15 TaxID=2725994 RepID=UPI0014496226|nr:hypothetical protein [Mycoplasma sp. 1654_15]QJB71325.1 hypothetical protein HF996_02440 [Mycoplasma sp. 1654_15]